MTIPLPVLEFAKEDGGNPLSWHEDQEKWVIVYEDGRKLVHLKEQKPHVVNTKPGMEELTPDGARKHAPRRDK